MNKRVFLLGLVPALAANLFLTTPAFSQSDFYRGKTITIVEGRRPGGTGAMRVAAAIPFLRKYIPGEPTLVVQFMPGGGGRKAANYIYNSARIDGTFIGNVGAGLVANAILGEPGVQYDIDKFIYLGSANSTINYVFKTVAKLGLDNLEKLQDHSGLRIGGQSVGHLIYINGRLFAWILGLKDPRFVTGYSGPELDVAMTSGEIDARANIVDTVIHRNPEFIEKGLVNFHAVINVPKGERHPHPLFGKLPALETFTRSEAERKVLEMFRTFRLVGSPYLLPPGIPEEPARVLREAMRKTFNDPAFHKEYKKLTGDEPTPLMPEAQEKAIKELPRDAAVISLFKQIAGSGALPSR